MKQSKYQQSGYNQMHLKKPFEILVNSFRILIGFKT